MLGAEWYGVKRLTPAPVAAAAAPDRQARLDRIAAVFAAWEDAHLDQAPFTERPRGSDYPLHHLTVDATPEQEADLQARVGDLTAAAAFHLPGGHDQDKHGGDGGGGAIDLIGQLEAAGLDHDRAVRVNRVNQAFHDRYGVGFTSVEPTDEHGLVAEVVGDKLMINPALAVDSRIARAEASGFLAPGTGDLEGLMTHELATRSSRVASTTGGRSSPRTSGPARPRGPRSQ